MLGTRPVLFLNRITKTKPRWGTSPARLKTGWAMRSFASEFSQSHPAVSSLAQEQPQHPQLRLPPRRAARISLHDAFESLRPFAVPISIAANQPIFSAGEDAADFYVVSRGVVRLCMATPQDDRLISDFMLANEPLGVVEHSSCRWSASAEAVTDADLLRISKAQAGYLLEDDTKAKGLASHAWRLAADAWRFRRTLIDKTPNQRLACFLIRFSQRTNTPIGRPMKLPISHRDIACHLGLMTEDVSAGFASFQRGGVIDLRDRVHCTILNATTVIGLAVQNMPMKNRQP